MKTLVSGEDSVYVPASGADGLCGVTDTPATSAWLTSRLTDRLSNMRWDDLLTHQEAKSRPSSPTDRLINCLNNSLTALVSIWQINSSADSSPLSR